MSAPFPFMAPRQVSAQEGRMLTLLATEQAIAEGSYRRHHDRAHREAAVRARLRYRSFFRAATGWHNFPEIP